MSINAIWKTTYQSEPLCHGALQHQVALSGVDSNSFAPHNCAPFLAHHAQIQSILAQLISWQCWSDNSRTISQHSVTQVAPYWTHHSHSVSIPSMTGHNSHGTQIPGMVTPLPVWQCLLGEEICLLACHNHRNIRPLVKRGIGSQHSNKKADSTFCHTEKWHAATFEWYLAVLQLHSPDNWPMLYL